MSGTKPAVQRTALVQTIVKDRFRFFVNVTALMVTLMSSVYAFIWWYIDQPYVALSCAVPIAVGMITPFYQQLRLSNATVSYLLLITTFAATYSAAIHAWTSTPIVMAYFPVMLIWVMERLGRRITYTAAAFCAVLIVLLPWTSEWAAPYPLFVGRVLDAYNLFNCLTLLLIVILSVIITGNLNKDVVTALESHQDDLLQSQKNLIEMQQYRNRFFAAVSHEIRTPMNAVRGISELLTQHAQLPPEENELVRSLQSSSTHLLSIINDLLDLSKLEENKLRIIESDFDVHAVIEEAHAIVRFAAKEKNIDLRIHIDTQLPRHIHTDPNRLRQVIVNVLNNAVKFTQQGFVELHCTTQRHAETKSHRLCMSVKDSGVGIPKEAQQHIFDGYVQAANVVGKEFGGTGLGLNISRRIVELLNGKIWFTSRVGVGSTFYIEIPYQAVANTTQVHQTHNDPIHLQTPFRVLLVEDNKLNIVVAKKLILSRSKSEIDIAENGLLALNHLESGAPLPDVILMDIHMPVMDGLETAHKIRAHHNPNIARIPIIAMTANTSDEDIQACFDAGMNEFTAKPLDINVLLLAMKKHLLDLAA